ncbi:MAG: HNH endonuclease, partial [Paludibacteraceae bacterium]|nr:HNH endonuclease [Paludibacteraceae bacterium]
MVSSFGNLWDNELKRFKLMREKVVGNNNGKKYYATDMFQHMYQVHRLVAYEFIEKYDVTSNIVINHIDNDGLNNHVDNLEITSARENCHHAMMIGVSNGDIIRTDKVIQLFCESYIKNNGDISKTHDELKGLGINEYFTTRFVSKLIRKKIWCDITDKYFKLGEYELPYKEQLTDDEIHAICKAIVKCGGSPKAA